MLRILLADSNLRLRSALALMLETRIDAQIVGQVSSLESLLCEVEITQPDVVIMDLDLQGELCNGCVDKVKQKSNHTFVIAMSVRPENGTFAMGAGAFICKTEPPETIIHVLETISHHSSIDSELEKEEIC